MGQFINPISISNQKFSPAACRCWRACPPEADAPTTLFPTTDHSIYHRVAAASASGGQALRATTWTLIITHSISSAFPCSTNPPQAEKASALLPFPPFRPSFIHTPEYLPTHWVQANKHHNRTFQPVRRATFP
jgi:hypothetical protein